MQGEGPRNGHGPEARQDFKSAQIHLRAVDTAHVCLAVCQVEAQARRSYRDKSTVHHVMLKHAADQTYCYRGMDRKRCWRAALVKG